MSRETDPLVADELGGSPGDLYDQLDQAGQRMRLMNDSWTHPSHLDPGLYRSDPQGHALLVGTNGRALTVLDMGGLVDIASVHVKSPEVLEQAADRLRFLAGRLRKRHGRELTDEDRTLCAEEAEAKQREDV